MRLLHAKGSEINVDESYAQSARELACSHGLFRDVSPMLSYCCSIDELTDQELPTCG